MAGARRKGTDNNRLILWPSGGEEGRWDQERRHSFSSFSSFCLRPLLLVGWYEWVCADTLEDIQSPHLCVFLSHAHTATWTYTALRCMYVLACELCSVYIFINLFIAAPVLKHVCLLCVTRLNVLLGAFSCLVDPKRVWLTRVSFISVFNIESGISAWGQILVWGGQGTFYACVCVCVCVRGRERN